MKIFSYDPKTGKRGAQIDNLERASYSSCSVDYLIRKGLMKDMGWITGDFGPDTEVTMHEDAGTHDRDGKAVSYRREEWVCFCTGCWRTGDQETWQWVVLPPKSALEEAGLQTI